MKTPYMQYCKKASTGLVAVHGNMQRDCRGRANVVEWTKRLHGSPAGFVTSSHLLIAFIQLIAHFTLFCLQCDATRTKCLAGQCMGGRSVDANGQCSLNCKG